MLARRPVRRPPAVFLAVACLLLVLAASCTEEVPVEVPKSALGAAASRSIVTINVDDPGLPSTTRDGTLRGIGLGDQSKFARDFYRQLIDEQLGHYPTALSERIGLKQIVLCKNLTFESAPCNAFADVERGVLYLCVDGGFDADQIKKTLHHEIFHQVDFADDRSLASDPRWEALNPPGFSYSRDSQRLQADPSASLLDDSLPGFLNRYSTSSPAEDKAELYSFMVVDPETVRRRASEDDVIRRKADLIRAALDRLGAFSATLLGR